MFVNRTLVKAILLTFLLNILSINAFTQLTQNSHIKEENGLSSPVSFAQQLQTGKNKDQQQQQHEEHLKAKKYYSNKEVVFGQDDEDEDSSSSKSEEVTAFNHTQNAAATVSSKNTQASSSSVASSSSSKNQQHLNKDLSEFGSFEHNSENSKNKNSEEESSYGSKLKRSQRTDHSVNSQKYDQEKLRQFHKQAGLQRNLLNRHANRLDFDYDQMLQAYLKRSALDLTYDQENINEDERLESLLSELNESINEEEEEEDKEDEISEESLNKFFEQLNQNRLLNNNKNNNIKNKPVNSKIDGKVEVKENLLDEKDYNKQFIKNQNLLDAGMPNAEIVNGGDKKAINSKSQGAPPAMALKQLNSHSYDNSIENKFDQIKKQNDHLFMFIVAGCAFAGVVALIAAGVCWYTVNKSAKITDFGLTKSGGKFNAGSKSSINSGDRRLAQSAQMYHYQHQKQQMIAMEKANNDNNRPDNSDNSDGETEEGDWTVYECPGLAPTGEMEVKNPLFKEEFSSHAIATMPPAYSSVISKPNQDQDQLIQIDTTNNAENKEQPTATTSVSKIVVTTENETEKQFAENSSTTQQQQKPIVQESNSTLVPDEKK